MPKRATLIMLSEKEQEGLLHITKRHRSEQQIALRARIVLAAAQGHTNVQIAKELDINLDTVRLWRDRWAGLQGDTDSYDGGSPALLMIEEHALLDGIWQGFVPRTAIMGS